MIPPVNPMSTWNCQRMECISFRRFSLSLLLMLQALLLVACGDYESRRNAYFDKGTDLFQGGDMVRARLELKNVLQIDEKFAPGWYWLGRVEEREGDYRKAFADYSHALELDAALHAARVRRGQIYVLANDLKLAAEDAEAVLKLVPADPDALMLRAAVRKRNGDEVGSEDDARAALAAKPGHAGASAMIANLLHDRGDRAGAIVILERGIAANPEIPALKLVLARYRHEAGNVEGAIAALNLLVSEHPGNSDYLDRLVSYLSQLGRTSEAETVLREAMTQAPADVERRKALVELVGKVRGPDAALAELAGLRDVHESLSLRFVEADLLRAAQRVQEAEHVLREIVVASGGAGPQAIRARNALAAMLAKENSEEAADLIAKVLKESPAEPDALQLRAAMALKAGEYEQAIGDLRSVLREYPDRAAAWRMIGQAHAANGESALARDAFGRAIRLQPTGPLAYLMLAELKVRDGDNEGALVTLESLLEKFPDNEAAQQAIARIQFSEHDWGALSKTAARIQETSPSDPLGFYLSGLVLQRRGDNGAALALFEKAIEVSPEAIEPVIALARSHLVLGDNDAAIRHARKVLDANPNSVAALNLLADIYVVAGNADAARATYGEAIRFHPKSPRAYVRLAQLEEQQGDLASAVAVLRRGADETNRNGALVFRMGNVLERAGDVQGAAAAYEEVLKIYPNADLVANGLAMLLANKGSTPQELDRAFELAQRFTDSQVPEYLDTLGWTRYQRNEHEAALPVLVKAVEKNGTLGELHFHLGLTYAKLGDIEKARKHLAVAAVSENFTDPAAARLALDALE